MDDQIHPFIHTAQTPLPTLWVGGWVGGGGAVCTWSKCTFAWGAFRCEGGRAWPCARVRVCVCGGGPCAHLATWRGHRCHKVAAILRGGEEPGGVLWGRGRPGDGGGEEGEGRRAVRWSGPVCSPILLLYHHHQKAFRNKSHTSHGHRPGLKRNKRNYYCILYIYFAIYYNSIYMHGLSEPTGLI